MPGMDNEIKRQPAGIPTGGEFAAHDRAEGAVALERVRTPPHEVMESLVDLAYAIDDALAFTGSSGAGKLMWGDLNTHAGVFAASEGVPEFAAGVAARIQFEGETTPLPRKIVRWAGGVHIDADHKQTIAADYVDDRLTEYDGPGHFTRADYAEVTSDGITYGFTVSPHILGEVAGVDERDDESLDEYVERVQEAEPELYKQLGDFMRERYGAEFIDDGGGYDTFEFHVDYPDDAGADGVTIEWMGDHAESTTKLLQFKNELEYGTAMQSALAERLGRAFELSTDPNRRFGDGRWVKSA